MLNSTLQDYFITYVFDSTLNRDLSITSFKAYMEALKQFAENHPEGTAKHLQGDIGIRRLYYSKIESTELPENPSEDDCGEYRFYGIVRLHSSNHVNLDASNRAFLKDGSSLNLDDALKNILTDLRNESFSELDLEGDEASYSYLFNAVPTASIHPVLRGLSTKP